MRPANRTATADLRPSSPGGPDGGHAEDLDPELVALRAPPQGQRLAALTVMAAAVVAAMALTLSLRTDMGYALASPQATDLGDVQSVAPSQLVSNSYVRLEGMVSVARAVGFSRSLGARYRVFPLAGQRTVYVQVPDEGDESFVRPEFRGRLVTFEELGGRYAKLAQVMRRDAGLPVSGASFLLLVDEPPSDYAWTWVVGLLCVAFVLLDAYFIVRWFKPAKWARVPADAPRE